MEIIEDIDGTVWTILTLQVRQDLLLTGWKSMQKAAYSSQQLAQHDIVNLTDTRIFYQDHKLTVLSSLSGQD